MRTGAKTLLLLMLAVAAIAPNANAAIDDNDKPIVSITPFLGYGFWSSDLAVDNSFLYGARGAFHLTRGLSLEGTWGKSSTNRTLNGVGVDLDNLGLDLVWELMPRSKWVPYIVGGWSQWKYHAEGAVNTEVLNGPEVGIGLKTRLGGNNANYRALRIDLRDDMSNLTPWFGNDDKLTHNLIASVGVQFAFGKSSRDSDNDGVRDRDDECEDSPVGATIDAVGCPVDSDGDGVFDGIDQCDGTPAGAAVDAAGCPSDTDGDGVFDGIDKCDNTPAGAVVDDAGCPVDSDGDGVFDGLDNCPDTPENVKVDKEGCPLTDVEVQLLDTGSLTTNQIVFEFSSAEIDVAQSGILTAIGEAMSDWPELEIEIIGHTDSSGPEEFNLELSQQRAASVLKYLQANFPQISDSQVKASGRGETQPIADNDTAEGRQANRRVEFKVLNTDKLEREVEKQ